MTCAKSTKMCLNMQWQVLWFLTEFSQTIFLIMVQKRTSRQLILSFFLLSDDELSQIADRYRIYAGRIILKAFPKFSFLADLIPKHIPHQYSDEMTGKSEVVTMPVLMKDEKKYSDFVNITKIMQLYIHLLLN